ncbi:MAG TPA: YwmB family TATA-box binding protein [Virgibacillus sp.]|nr:YwmB family TATA-box binding protein [Virgibacillus sp.]
MQINKKGLIHILIIFLFFTITSSASGQKTDELIELTGIIADSNLEVDEWTVTIKEKMPTTKAKKVLDNLGETHNISVTETDELIKYKAVQIKEGNNFTDIYELKIAKNKPLVSDVSATINGEAWNEDIQAHYKEYSKRILNKNFTENSRVYTCISTRDSDIINFVYIIEHITRMLDLKNVSTQTDTIRHSPHRQLIYGYTPLWEEKIVVKTVPTNIQIVIESAEDGKEKMIIGTPILINEY